MKQPDVPKLSRVNCADGSASINGALALVIGVALILAQPAMAKPTKKTRASAATSREVRAGKILYRQYDCKTCHTLSGQGCPDGISLDGLAKTRTKQWIADQMLDPEGHTKKFAKQMGYDPNMMPDMNISPKEAQAIAAYLLSVPEKATPAAKPK